MLNNKALFFYCLLGYCNALAMNAPNSAPNTETVSCFSGLIRCANAILTRNATYQEMNQRAYEQEIIAAVHNATTVTDAIISTQEFKEESALIGAHIKQKFSTEDIFKEFEKQILSEDIAAVTILLQAGVNPNKKIFKQKRFAQWHRPLVYTCQNPGNLAMVKLFLAHGADPHKTGKCRLTPLHAATLSNTSNAIAQELLQHGASWYIFNDEFKTPLSFAAASTYPAIKQLFEQEFLLQNQKYITGIFKQYNGIGQDLPMDIQWLITRYVVDDVLRAQTAKEAFENTKAYHTKNPHLIARLLFYKFSLNGLYHLILNGYFVPLSFMYTLHNIDKVCDSTLKKIHRLLDLPSGSSFKSIYNYHYSATRSFVNFSLDDARRKKALDTAPNLSLLHAIHTDNQSKLRCKILRLPEELNTNNYEQMKTLLNDGADPNAECLGITPLIEAVCSCNKNAIQLLLEHNADTEKRDAYGRGPVEIACNNQACIEPENTEVYNDYEEIKNLIIDAYWKKIEEDDDKKKQPHNA